MSRNKKLFVAGVLVFVAVIILAITIATVSTRPKEKGDVIITVVPSSAIIELDGAKIQNGSVAVSTGEHTITATLDNFEQYKSSFSIATGETKTIDIILTPIDRSLSEWYSDNDHRDQQIVDYPLLDGIASHEYAEMQKQFVDAFPIIKDLPHYEKMKFDVSYGADSSNPGQVVLFVVIFGDTKADFLNWLHSKGYDENDYTIIYK